MFQTANLRIFFGIRTDVDKKKIEGCCVRDLWDDMPYAHPAVTINAGNN